MTPSMYDAYLSVGDKPSVGVDDADKKVVTEEAVTEESLTGFLLATLSGAKIAAKVVSEEKIEVEDVVEDVVDDSIDYISAYTNATVVEAPEEEVVVEVVDTEEVEEVIEEAEEEVPEAEEEVVEEEVVEEETEDLGAFILDTIKSQVVKEVTPEDAVAELQAIEEAEEEEVEVEVEAIEEEVEDVDDEESLGDFIRRTIAKEAKSAITDTEAQFEEEINDIVENVTDKKDRKKQIAKVKRDKKEAITAIEERKGETIEETLLQLELVDKDADDDSEEDAEFKGGNSKLKKELQKSIKAMFLEEQIKLRKQIELTSGGGGAIGGGSSTLQTNNISEYRCDLNVFYYSGWLQEGSTIFIKRTDGDDEQFATGLTDLETDWANRLNLNYV
jgi:hypothetical protein